MGCFLYKYYLLVMQKICQRGYGLIITIKQSGMSFPIERKRTYYVCIRTFVTVIIFSLNR